MMRIKRLKQPGKKRKAIKEKTYKVLEYADPLVEKTPERSIVIICVVFLLVFIYKSVTGFYLLSFTFKNIGDADLSTYWFLVEYFYLPVAIFFLWRKTKTGWTLFLIWLIYQVILDCAGLYMWYQLSDIDPSFLQLMSMPSLSTCLVMLSLHGGLIYFICKPNIKALFSDKVADDTLNQGI